MDLGAGTKIKQSQWAARGKTGVDVAVQANPKPSSCRLVVLCQILAIALCGSFNAFDPALAGALSCSSAEAVSTVISIEKNALGNIPFYVVFDLDNTDFSLVSIRTEGGNGYKFECAAKMIGDPQPKHSAGSNEKNDEIMRKMLAGSFKEGLPIHYTVQNTDDGKLYVELLNRSGG